MGPDHGNVVIAHHQVHTIFQGLPRQVPPDHMCHPRPISRVMSGAQNFALKSQISLPNKSLQTLWTIFLLRPIMGHEICWFFFSAENWDPVTPNRLQFFLRTLVFLVFQRNSTTQIVYLTSAEKIYIRRNLVFRPMVRRNSSSGFV